MLFELLHTLGILIDDLRGQLIAPLIQVVDLLETRIQEQVVSVEVLKFFVFLTIFRYL